MSLVTCKNLTLGYEGKAVVSRLEFAVNAGDYLCVVGDNGSGKSTLIKALLKLNVPMEGSILVDGEWGSKHIGYLPQQLSISGDFPATVQEVVLSGCLNRMGLRPFYGSLEKTRAIDAMKKLGVAELSSRCYRELSGGQRQRVLLARALCATQKMLLLDEPVAGLDPLATGDMYTLMEKLNKEDGITIIMVTHDISSAVSYASHVLHIDNVQKFFGTKDAYIQSDIGKAYIAIRGGEQNA